MPAGVLVGEYEKLVVFAISESHGQFALQMLGYDDTLLHAL